jgi:hypothetical protein
MRRPRFASLAVVVLLHFILNTGGASSQSINEVLDAVSSNVKEFQDFLPDFVCAERVTSTELDSGRVIKERVVESIFTGVQRSNEENRIHFAFTESREVLTIDGKPARKGTAFPKLPYHYSGGFSSLLITTFAPDNLQVHNYSIADHYKSENSSALLVRFTTKENQTTLRGIFLGKQLIAKDIGSAWIDEKSFRVLRLQRQSLNLPADLTRSVATADYGPVTIGERQFWMPTRIRAEVNGRNPRVTVRYVADYSDCRKFTADIKLVQ